MGNIDELDTKLDTLSGDVTAISKGIAELREMNTTHGAHLNDIHLDMIARLRELEKAIERVERLAKH